MVKVEDGILIPGSAVNLGGQVFSQEEWEDMLIAKKMELVSPSPERVRFETILDVQEEFYSILGASVPPRKSLDERAMDSVRRTSLDQLVRHPRPILSGDLILPANAR